MKTRDMKKPARPRMVTKRQATNHTAGKQVPLKNRNTSASLTFKLARAAYLLFSEFDFRARLSPWSARQAHRRRGAPVDLIMSFA